jgi:hypothetical protein
LLLKFKDNLTEPYPRSFYENLFTTTGTGTMNLTDFFQDASLRKLNVTGSKVLGWFTLDSNRSDPHSRSDLIALTKLAAFENNVDLSPYAVVVACFNVPTDSFGGDGFACVDPGIWNADKPNGGQSDLSPSIAGHEIGHGYGLDHSRIIGSSNDYQDQWDIMSALNTFMAPDPTLTQVDSKGRRIFWIGPMLNAANMDGRGWLNEARVWTAAGTVNETIVLRPLTRPDLPGFLVARIGGYLVEFRVNEGWDAAIPRPAVLVHLFNNQDNRSYLMKGTNGQKDLVGGDVFQIQVPDGGPWVMVRPLIIDSAGYTATIQLMCKL